MTVGEGTVYRAASYRNGILVEYSINETDISYKYLVYIDLNRLILMLKNADVKNNWNYYYFSNVSRMCNRIGAKIIPYPTTDKVHLSNKFQGYNYWFISVVTSSCVPNFFSTFF